ncbi:MAG: hemolysin family protein [Rhodobiaceae bacterium]|jgi:magnesium and cobalt transporter
MSAPQANGTQAPLYARLWRRLFGNGEANLRESIEGVLDESEGNDAGFSSEERHMLRNLLGFRDVRVDDVMVPRADIKAVDENTNHRDLLPLFADCGHSRMPVFRETLDQPVGMVHVKDVLTGLQADMAAPEEEKPAIMIAELLRPLLFVPPSMPALDLLLKMQATRQHMALVIDEYGGTDGLVTIEDLIEEIVGEIEDEHDEDDGAQLRRLGDGLWRAQARLPLDELEAELGLPFSDDESFAEVDTLGGLVFAIAGRVPERGEMIGYDAKNGREIEFVIRDSDPRRIKTLDIKMPIGA